MQKPKSISASKPTVAKMRDACGDSTPKALDGLAQWPPMGFFAGVSTFPHG